MERPWDVRVSDPKIKYGAHASEQPELHQMAHGSRGCVPCTVTLGMVR